MKEEGFATEVAMDPGLILRRKEALARTHTRCLVSVIREAQLLITPEYLENLPMFDDRRNGMVEGHEPTDQNTRYSLKTENVHGRFGTQIPERSAGENTGGSERRRLVGEAPGDPVCDVAGIARQASNAPGVAPLDQSEKGSK
jgi:hypothetical protein